MTEPIYVNRPELPPLDDFIEKLEIIWRDRVLTNNGPFLREFERKLGEYLEVSYVSVFSSGMAALTAALATIEPGGEVITTPYSFVATAGAIKWNKQVPVFVDTEEGGFNIDPRKLVSAITERTSAILPVHCYGFPCNLSAIEAISKEFSIPVIYDAAHAFGARVGGIPLCSFGDASVLSFHATKVFNTFEGGAVVTHRKDIKDKVDLIRNFGQTDNLDVLALGINGKMDEANAALGLIQMSRVDSYIERRAKIWSYYKYKLGDLRGLKLPVVPPNLTHNYSYYPIIVGKDSPVTRDELFNALAEASIFARRYFYPLITNMMPFRGARGASSVVNAAGMADRILCLPIYPSLSESEQDRVIDTIRGLM